MKLPVQYRVLRRQLHCTAVAVLWLAISSIPVSSVLGQTTGVRDDFDRPDSSSLGISTTGQTWSTVSGSIGIQSGRATPAYGFFLTSIDGGSSSLNVDVTVTQPSHEFWVVLRYANEQNYWRFGRWNGQTYTLQQVQNNSLGGPSIEFGVPILAQSGDHLSCKLRTGMMECRVNGAIVARTTDGFASSATRVGLSGYEAAAARFDDFTALAPSLPDLTLTMSGPSFMYHSTEGVWNATVNNVGVLPVQFAEVIITPSANVSNVSIVGSSCFVDGSSWSCPLGALAVAQLKTLEIHATAPATLTSLAFSATVAGSLEEDDPTNNAASVTTVTRQPPPPGAIVFDSFERADGSAGQTYTGHAWVIYSGALNVSGGQAAPGDGFVLAAVDTGQAVGELSTILVTPSSEFWAILRLSDSANYWRFGRGNGQGYQLQRIQANSAKIHPPLTNIAPAAGDAIRCVYWLDQIECSVNGVVAARVSDAFNQTASEVGFSSYLAPATRFDQLLVTPPPPRIDVSVTIEGPSLIRSGQPGSWTITFVNRGTSVVGVTEVVVAPSSQLSGVGVMGASCALQSAQYRCSISTLAPGGSVTITLAGTAPAAPAVLNISATYPVQVGEIQVSDNTVSYSMPVRRAIPANALVVDLFDRPNSETLGTANTGQLWANHFGGSGIQNGEVALSSSLTTLNTAVTGGDISATVSSTSSEFWLVLRLSDSQNYWRFGRWHDGPYELQQVRANQLGSPALQLLGVVQPAIGDQIACRVSTLAIDCAVNDVAVVRTSDTFNRTATRVGFSAYAWSVVRFDDLVVVQVPTGPDLSVTVQAPHIALKDSGQMVHVDVRNNGDSPALGATLSFSLPSTIHVVSAPSGCTLAPQLQCNLGSSQSPGGFERLTLTLSATTTGAFSGSADAAVVGDAFAADNHASWTTAVETAESGILDNFARSDTPVGLGSTLTGQAWQSIIGGFQIAGSEARAISSGSLTGVDAGFAFGTLEVVLGSSAESAGIAFRIVDANNYYRLTADQGGFYRVTKVVNGTVQNLQFYISRHITYAQPGDLVRIVSRPDDGVFVAVNGRHILDAGDQQFMHATGWGLLSVGGSPTFRSFALRPVAEGFATLDSFSGTPGSWIGTPTSGVYYNWLRWMGSHWVYDSGATRPEWDAYTVMTLDTSSERATVKAKLVEPGSGGWIVLRYVEGGSYFRFGHEARSSYDVDYWSGEWPLVMPVEVQQFATVVPAAGDVLEVRQAADGTVECWVNGTMTHRFIDATGPGFRSTLTGLAGNDTSVRFDDFTVTPLPR